MYSIYGFTTVWEVCVDYRAQSVRTCCIEVSKLEVKVDGEDNLCSYIYIDGFVVMCIYTVLP